LPLSARTGSGTVKATATADASTLLFMDVPRKVEESACIRTYSKYFFFTGDIPRAGLISPRE